MATLSSTLSHTTLNFPKPISDHQLLFTLPYYIRTWTVPQHHPHHSTLRSRLSYGIEPLCVTPRRQRTRRLSAAVAQEEAEAVAEVAVEEEKEKEKEKEELKEEEEKVGTKLYFGNLPWNFDSATLAGIVQEYADPELVEVLYDRETGKSRGFAFVTMGSVEDCNKVIKNLDKTEVGGRNLRVNFADKPRPKEPLFPETNYRLFIGNLSWSVTSNMLREAFKGVGEVVEARVIYNGETGRSRGYGFVSFATNEAMDAALESLNGLELEGRAIRISIAEGRK
ncbi:33 kDa ribonucleoprotein, chloroplastic-like protein [Drosera capensis]